MCNKSTYKLGIDKARKGLKKTSALDTLGIVSPNLVKPSKSGHSKFIKKQIAKAITLAQLFKLIDLDSPLKKSYWQTYHCNNVIRQEGQKFISTYCDQRWCTVCNRIRMAKMINAYSLQLINLNQIYFVTLTLPNVKDIELRDEIDKMLLGWRSIYKKLKRSKYKYLSLKGMRKLECTYNFSADTYNPHFHLLIDTEETATKIIQLWLEHFPSADIKGQDKRKADNNSLIELFKYSVKGINKGKFNAYPLDVIYQAMYYRKTYYPIGITKLVEENINGIESELITFKGNTDDVWTWSKEMKDWRNQDGELLTGYIIDGKLNDWIEKLIDKDKVYTQTVNDNNIELSIHDLGFIKDNIGYDF